MKYASRPNKWPSEKVRDVAVCGILRKRTSLHNTNAKYRSVGHNDVRCYVMTIIMVWC
jgi:hypothetical protein